MVDGNEIKFNPAYELAFLRPEEQAVLYDILQAEEVTPSLSQAQRLKRASQEGTIVRTGHCCDHAGGKGADQRYRESNASGKGDRAILSEKLYARTEKKVIVKLLASWARQRESKSVRMILMKTRFPFPSKKYLLFLKATLLCILYLQFK